MCSLFNFHHCVVPLTTAIERSTFLAPLSGKWAGNLIIRQNHRFYENNKYILMQYIEECTPRMYCYWPIYVYFNVECKKSRLADVPKSHQVNN